MSVGEIVIAGITIAGVALIAAFLVLEIVEYKERKALRK